MQRQKLIGGMLVVILSFMLVAIYLMGSQLRHEMLATRSFEKGEYDQAAEQYLKAYESATFGRDRYLYLVGQCYYNDGDWQRAMDFFVKLTRDYSVSSYAGLAQPMVSRVLEKLNPEINVDPSLLKAHTPLALALSDCKASFRRLKRALIENRAGISVELVGEYEKYRKYQEILRTEKRKAWALIAQEGHPMREGLAPPASPAPTVPPPVDLGAAPSPVTETGPHPSTGP